MSSYHFLHFCNKLFSVSPSKMLDASPTSMLSEHPTPLVTLQQSVKPSLNVTCKRRYFSSKCLSIIGRQFYFCFKKGLNLSFLIYAMQSSCILIIFLQRKKEKIDMILSYTSMLFWLFSVLLYYLLENQLET